MRNTMEIMEEADAMRRKKTPAMNAEERLKQDGFPVSRKATVTPFVKHDQEKPRMDLVVPEFLLLMGGVLAHGASKYSDNNWKECANSNRYTAAAMRHLLAAMDGEGKDAESGYSHFVHVAVNAMFAWYLESVRPATVTP